MRTIVFSFIICGVMLLGWNQLVQRKLRGMRTTGAASQFDQNVMKAQSFVYTRWQPKVVIAGSSISARLTKHPAEWYNLAFAGGSAFTALDIISRSDKTPELVLIETNVLNVPEDHRLLDSLFFPVLSKARDRYPGLREQYKPSHVLVTALPDKPDTSSKGLSSERFDEQVSRRLKELSVPPKTHETDAIIQKLKRYVQILDRRGIRVAFFEAPEYAQGTNLPRRAVIRDAVHAAFPEKEYAWVPAVDAQDYSTTDAVHLDPGSAKRYVDVIAHYVKTIHDPPTSRPSSGESAVVNLSRD